MLLSNKEFREQITHKFKNQLEKTFPSLFPFVVSIQNEVLQIKNQYYIQTKMMFSLEIFTVL